jgi:L-lactate dehydrogenase complex protein LldF
LLGGWTQARDLREMPKETFRDWWERRSANGN